MHDVIDCYSLRPVVPNERLYVDDRLFSHHIPLIKKTPEKAVNKRPSKACHVCFAKGKHTAKRWLFENNICL